MRRLLYLATLSMLVMLVLAPTALAQTVETVPLNPDGACPEGFVTVNAAYKQPEKNSEQGRGERKDYKTRKDKRFCNGTCRQRYRRAHMRGRIKPG